mmetsp:Transcript_5634/g.23103  ORF Transcript_5634/g.23103 Transcript_5634/m.23103 type:complete len:439 (-) Transcript_5634:359-1675(-)
MRARASSAAARVDAVNLASLASSSTSNLRSSKSRSRFDASKSRRSRSSSKRASASCVSPRSAASALAQSRPEASGPGTRSGAGGADERGYLPGLSRLFPSVVWSVVWGDDGFEPAATERDRNGERGGERGVFARASGKSGAVGVVRGGRSFGDGRDKISATAPRVKPPLPGGFVSPGPPGAMSPSLVPYSDDDPSIRGRRRRDDERVLSSWVRIPPRPRSESTRRTLPDAFASSPAKSSAVVASCARACFLRASLACCSADLSPRENSAVLLAAVLGAAFSSFPASFQAGAGGSPDDVPAASIPPPDASPLRRRGDVDVAASRARRLASSFASAASALSAAADADSSASSRSRRAGDDRSRGASRLDRAEDDAPPRDVLDGALPPPGGASAPPLCRDATLSGACRNAASFESTGWVKSTLKSLCVARFFRKKAMTRKL